MEIPFPWEQLTGEPLVYASMGALHNGNVDVFRTALPRRAATPTSSRNTDQCQATDRRPVHLANLTGCPLLSDSVALSASNWAFNPSSSEGLGGIPLVIAPTKASRAW